MTRPLQLAIAVVACLVLGAAEAVLAACVVDTDCPAVQCQNPTCQDGTCVSDPNNFDPDFTLCDDGDKCSLGERCMTGVCEAPLNAGKDNDHDGACDVDESSCGCDPNNAMELCPLPNKLVGRAGNSFGEVLINWNAPTVKRVLVASDPSCAEAGECTDGICTKGKIQDVCTTNAECNEAPDTCRVVVNWADRPDLTLLSARLGKTDIDIFTPVTHGCSLKVDVLLPPEGRLHALKVKAQGTVNGKLQRDKDVIRYFR